jgi:hypothetical protein
LPPELPYAALTVDRLRRSQHLLAIVAGATAIGWIVGFATMIVLLPLLLFPLFFVVALIAAVPLGLMLALPVTALLLPVAAAAGERFDADRRLLLPLIGVLGGAAVVILVFTKGQFWLADEKVWRFVVAGALAGLAAGCFFARTWPKRP